MKITYDKETDTLTLAFRDAGIAESDGLTKDIIADFDENGKVVAVEMLDASTIVSGLSAITNVKKEKTA